MSDAQCESVSHQPGLGWQFVHAIPQLEADLQMGKKLCGNVNRAGLIGHKHLEGEADQSHIYINPVQKL